MVDFQINETIFSKEANLSCHTNVDMAEKENWAEDCALGDSRLYRNLITLRDSPSCATFIQHWMRKAASQA